MKKTNAQPLKDVIQEYLQALKMDTKLKEVGLIGSWERIVGGVISKATKNIYIKDKILYVKLNSSVIRNELELIKTPLKDRLNSEAKHEVIDEIKFY